MSIEPENDLVGTPVEPAQDTPVKDLIDPTIPETQGDLVGPRPKDRD